MNIVDIGGQVHLSEPDTKETSTHNVFSSLKIILDIISNINGIHGMGTLVFRVPCLLKMIPSLEHVAVGTNGQDMTRLAQIVIGTILALVACTRKMILSTSIACIPEMGTLENTLEKQSLASQTLKKPDHPPITVHRGGCFQNVLHRDKTMLAKMVVQSLQFGKRLVLIFFVHGTGILGGLDQHHGMVRGWKIHRQWLKRLFHVPCTHSIVLRFPEKRALLLGSP